ncbi:MAG: hypothetical protein IT383_28295 [Deltaproteobacteria bacterium]|nr:hypothetical protein [Deltaproteobacteria bacterium]
MVKAAAPSLTDNAVPEKERIRRAAELAADPRPQALDELLAGLQVMGEELREAIVAALKKKNAGGPTLDRAVDVKAKPDARINALAGVRALKPKDAAARLAPLLNDTKANGEPVREAIAFALCTVDPTAAEAALVQSIKAEPSAKVRYYVAIALGELKSSAAKGAVSAQLKLEKDLAVLDSLERAQRKHNGK